MRRIDKIRKSKNWLVMAQAKRCDHYASLKEAGFISWKKERNNFAVGDTVYIFSSSERKIIFKTVVVCEEMRADGKYWHETPPMQLTWRLEAVSKYCGEDLTETKMKEHGFNGGRSLQHPMCNNPILFDFIESKF